MPRSMRAIFLDPPTLERATHDATDMRTYTLPLPLRAPMRTAADRDTLMVWAEINLVFPLHYEAS
jgi:hypothetical protein